TTTGAAAPARTQSRTVPRTDARARAGACSAAVAAAERVGGGWPTLERTGEGETGRRQGLRGDIQVLHGRRRFLFFQFCRRWLRDGHFQLVFAFELGLARRIDRLVAAAPAAAARTGH